MIFFKFFKYQHIIDRIFKQENLTKNLTKMFGSELQRDWVGRYWTVLNPYVQDMKDEVGGASSTYSYDETGALTNSVAVEKWVMDKLNIANTMMVNNGLFEILSYDIKEIDEDQNYLFVMKNVLWEDFSKTVKILAILITVMLALAGAYLIFW